MPSGQRSWRTSAKHLASSNSPERLTRSDAGMIARAPCMKTPAAYHPIRSLARRLPAPLPLITPEANKSLFQYPECSNDSYVDFEETCAVCGYKIEVQNCNR